MRRIGFIGASILVGLALLAASANSDEISPAVPTGRYLFDRDGTSVVVDIVDSKNWLKQETRGGLTDTTLLIDDVAYFVDDSNRVIYFDKELGGLVPEHPYLDGVFLLALRNGNAEMGVGRSIVSQGVLSDGIGAVSVPLQLSIMGGPTGNTSYVGAQFGPSQASPSDLLASLLGDGYRLEDIHSLPSPPETTSG